MLPNPRNAVTELLAEGKSVEEAMSGGGDWGKSINFVNFSLSKIKI